MKFLQQITFLVQTKKPFQCKQGCEARPLRKRNAFHQISEPIWLCNFCEAGELEVIKTENNVDDEDEVVGVGYQWWWELTYWLWKLCQRESAREESEHQKNFWVLPDLHFCWPVILSKSTPKNKLASIKATLVWNIDSPTNPLTDWGELVSYVLSWAVNILHRSKWGSHNLTAKG